MVIHLLSCSDSYTALAIHGGAFVLGYAEMVSADQIDDCLERGWIVVALEHRLCPQVDIYEGPVTDCRDALHWVYSGGLSKQLQTNHDTSTFAVDMDRVVAFGTSSGGTLALALVRCRVSLIVVVVRQLIRAVGLWRHETGGCNP